MELGGNKNAKLYYEENDMFENGKPNHRDPRLAKYKQELASRAISEINGMLK